MFTKEFKRVMTVMALIIFGFAVSQYVFAADRVIDRLRAEEGGIPVRETRADSENAREFVRDMNRSLNQDFDPAGHVEGRLYDRTRLDDYLDRDTNFRNNLRDDFDREYRNELRNDLNREYRDDLREIRERQLRDRIETRRDARLSDEARQLQDLQDRADREYISRRQDLLGRMGSHPIGSTEYNRYNTELRRLEERQLERQNELNDRVRSLQLLESTSYSR